MAEIDRTIGEMKSDIKNMQTTAEIHQKNMEATTTRIEEAVEKGFEKQAVINTCYDERIRGIKNKLYWLIGVLAGAGALSGGAYEIFGG